MKLYVGNLSFQTTEGALEELFTQFGTVTEALLVMDKLTQRPRGFGFVTMGSAEEAQKAIEGLNGQSVDGRTLIVNEARPREDRPPRRDFGGGGGGGSRGGGGGGYRGGGGGNRGGGGGGGYRDRGDRGDRR
ncbi:MAG: RNA recognition motif domain-containing protein [Terrimicrobiaceae bacterium]